MKDAKHRLGRAFYFLALVSLFVLLYWLFLDVGERPAKRSFRPEVKR
jgi:hypothetical protein